MYEEENQQPDDDYWDCPTCLRPMPVERDYDCGCCGGRASHHISITSMCKIMRSVLDRETALKVEVNRLNSALDEVRADLEFRRGLFQVQEQQLNDVRAERDEWKAKQIQQNKDLGCEMMDPAGTIWDYASATQRENVQLKREVERERALANEAIATWKKTREERDAALIGYNECRATIEDARRALGATAHEGPLLAAMRVTEQRDRLAEAIRKHRDELKLTSGDSVDRILWNTLEAVEGGSDD
jgi:hypothetical protein